MAGWQFQSSRKTNVSATMPGAADVAADVAGAVR